jgi:hypothetical protein
VLSSQAEEVSRTLVGLIRAVEKEVNPVKRAVAKVTSLIVSLGFAVCRVQGCRVTG